MLDTRREGIGGLTCPGVFEPSSQDDQLSSATLASQSVCLI